eukprot:624903-Prymnesium_polylepis.1
MLLRGHRRISAYSGPRSQANALSPPFRTLPLITRRRATTCPPFSFANDLPHEPRRALAVEGERHRAVQHAMVVPKQRLAATPRVRVNGIAGERGGADCAQVAVDEIGGPIGRRQCHAQQPRQLVCTVVRAKGLQTLKAFRTGQQPLDAV